MTGDLGPVGHFDREVTVEYTPELIRSAIFRYWVAIVGPFSFGALAVVGGACSYLLLTGERSWVIGSMTTIFVILTSMLAFAYFRLLGISMAKFRRMETPTALFRFTDTTIYIETDSGKSEFTWRSIDKILKFPDIWMIVFVGGGQITLPTKTIDSDLQDLILGSVPSK